MKQRGSVSLIEHEINAALYRKVRECGIKHNRRSLGKSKWYYIHVRTSTPSWHGNIHYNSVLTQGEEFFLFLKSIFVTEMDDFEETPIWVRHLLQILVAIVYITHTQSSEMHFLNNSQSPPRV